MRISVRQGDVRIRAVTCGSHSRGIYSFHIETPLDPYVHLNCGELCEGQAESGRWKALRHTIVDVYAVQRDEPSRITITPESPNERAALAGWLLPYSDRHRTVLIAIPGGTLDYRGDVIASWKAAPSKVDYLESQY